MVASVFKRLDIAGVFNTLIWSGKLYAHHLSRYVVKHDFEDWCKKFYSFRAAWYGARITLRQVSPEANTIFDLLIELPVSCDGNWLRLLDEGCAMEEAKYELERFMEYAALFLSNMGNYYVCCSFESRDFAKKVRLVGPRTSEIHPGSLSPFCGFHLFDIPSCQTTSGGMHRFNAIPQTGYSGIPEFGCKKAPIIRIPLASRKCIWYQRC